jgi:hypothetical protein
MIKPRSLLVPTCLLVIASFLTYLVFGVVGDSGANQVTDVNGATPERFVEILEIDGERVINIGEWLNADGPSLLTGGDGREVNIGGYLDVDDQSQFEADEGPQDIGQPVDADDLGFATTVETVEYQNIGPKITVEDYFQSYGSEDGEPQNIGPMLDADAKTAYISSDDVEINIGPLFDPDDM